MDGEYHNLFYHEQRMNHALRNLYGTESYFNLERFLNDIDRPAQGLYKCRVAYDDQTTDVEFLPYTPRPVNTLRVVEHDRIHYEFKYCDRTNIDRLFALRQDKDDVLIVKRGLVTDTSYANILFKKGKRYYTPWSPLLKGTMRQQLLEKDKIIEEEIRVEDISGYESFKLINAMIGFDGADLPVQNIFSTESIHKRMVRYIVLFFCLLQLQHVQAQQALATKNKKAVDLYMQADNYRVRAQYNEALAALNEAITRDKNFTEAYYRMGLVYIGKKNYDEAIRSFENGLRTTENIAKQKVFWYDMADCYFALGNYEQAKVYAEKFSIAETSNTQKIEHVRKLLRDVSFAIENNKIYGQYKRKALSDTVNAWMMQYFPVLTADQQQLIFTRRRGDNMNINEDDEDIVVAKKDVRGRWTKPVSLSDNINTATMNEGTCTISADGRTLIFTSCIGRQVYGSCDLFVTRKIGDAWSAPENLGPNVNTPAWESQPSLSADGRTLYFVSDRRGGSYGRRDIWVTSQNEKGEWMKARNAGKLINSIYDEISPFIHVNNRTLYFASNGLTGFGGYDVFYSERDTTGTWQKPLNMGAPINNHEDQFALFITADGKKGYYAHEEVTAKGETLSRIFEIEIPEANRLKFCSGYVKGKVYDTQTKKPLAASIELVNLATDERELIVNSDSVSGEYLMILTQGAEYALYINKRAYLFQSINFNYTNTQACEPVVKDIGLEKISKGTSIVLNNIFFAFDQYALEDKSKTELLRLIIFMIDNPQVKITISGHTDNVGKPQYNKQLSTKRAQAVYNYLIQNNINASRLRYIGFGADQPIATNDTEAGRQVNRRIALSID